MKIQGLAKTYPDLGKNIDTQADLLVPKHTEFTVSAVII